MSSAIANCDLASGLWLGALRLIPARDAAAIVGIALTAHGVPVMLNVGRIRDSGLTMVQNGCW